MSVDYRDNEMRRFVPDLQARENEIAAVLKVSSSPSSPKSQQMNDKRVRREIANGNERRRMQCINAGFNSLRALIPHMEGEKLSKAAILQQSIDYITSLEKDKSRLQMKLDQTSQLLAELGQADRVPVDPFVANSPPPSKRKKRDTESSDEGVGSLSDASDDCGTDLRQKNEVLKHLMDKERNRGDSLEEENKSLRNLIILIQNQKQASRETQPITLLTTVPQDCRPREMLEVISPRLNYTPPHHQDELMEYSLPMPPSSFSPTQTVAMVTGNTPQILSSAIISAEQQQQQPLVMSGLKVELRDTPSVGFLTPPPSQGPVESSTAVITTTTTSSESTAQQSSDSSVLHNYAHRDHPRRRRHQAQLERERVEQEERQQQEQEERRQEELQLRLQQQFMQQQQTTTYIPRANHSVRSLDILAEAANHVKDDQTNRLYLSGGDGPQPAQMGGRVFTSLEVSEQTTPQSVTAALVNLPNFSTSTTAESLSQHHIVPQTISHQVPIIVTSVATSENSSSNSFCEKYPIASHLLHRPLHPPFTRPGVIVQKH